MFGFLKKKPARQIKIDKLNAKIQDAIDSEKKPIFDRNESMMIASRIHKGFYEEEHFIKLNAGLYRLNI